MTFFLRGISFVLFLLILGLNACKCRRDESQENPCTGKKATGASFDIYENANSSAGGNYFPDWTAYVTDTVTLSTMDFIASDTIALNYSWTIGSNTYNTKKVTINFSSRPAGQNQIPITLKVKKQSHSACFPSDTGSMELTKLMVIADSSIVSGKFKGVRMNEDGSNVSDSFSVSMYTNYPVILYDGSNMPYDTVNTFVVSNLYPGCTTNTVYDLISAGYKEIVFGGLSSNNCHNISGKAILQPDNDHIVIYYSHYDTTPSSYKKYIFNGVRE